MLIKGKHFSEEHKRKIGKGNIKYPFGPGYCHNCSKKLSNKELKSFGMWCSISCFHIKPVDIWKLIYCKTCEKPLLRLNNSTTKYCSAECMNLCEEYRQNISKANTRRYEDPKERRKTSEANKKRWEDEEFRQKNG